MKIPQFIGTFSLFSPFNFLFSVFIGILPFLPRYLPSFLIFLSSAHPTITPFTSL